MWRFQLLLLSAAIGGSVVVAGLSAAERPYSGKRDGIAIGVVKLPPRPTEAAHANVGVIKLAPGGTPACPTGKNCEVE